MREQKAYGCICIELLGTVNGRGYNEHTICDACDVGHAMPLNSRYIEVSFHQIPQFIVSLRYLDLKILHFLCTTTTTELITLPLVHANGVTSNIDQDSYTGVRRSQS